MPQKPSIRKRHATAQAGPISPGSPLHRLLKIVASAIVERFESEAPPHVCQRKRR